MIEIDLSKCTGCRQCETTCAFLRSGKSSRNLSRIKIMSSYSTGIDGPIVCQQCQERYCVQSCSFNALTVGTIGQVIISPTICTRCGACERSCPIGAIEEYHGIYYVCDLCGGRPQCVDVCTEHAIEYKPEKIETVSLSTFKQNSKGMTVSERRFSYISAKGNEIRKNWRNKNA
ncbi:4Fe-4S dicluster domain-containing protein [Candidatus Lokiarchaeum ossiferum]|uniref:4Fe-4S dicluster domain-containing protein n=1 Tax=Candidatus Lokiarchaeum ossiferum TaxID=2951803 RepID=UPI00352E231C